MPTQLTALLARLTRPEPAPPWSLLAVAGAWVVGFVAVIVGTLAANAWLGDQALTLLLGWMAANLLLIVFLVATRRAQVDALHIGQLVQPAALILLVSLGAAILLDVLGLSITGQFLPVPELQTLLISQPLHVDVSGWVLAVVYMVIVQPIAEEALFRGMAFPALRTALTAWGGLVLCALAYAVFHGLAYPPPWAGIAGWWYGLLLPFVVGLYLSAVRAYTGSTRAAMFAHAAFGLFAVVKLFTLVG